jgi:hypothetical protein
MVGLSWDHYPAPSGCVITRRVRHPGEVKTLSRTPDYPFRAESNIPDHWWMDEIVTFEQSGRKLEIW